MEKENPFQGKVAVVTGGAGAIGREISLLLAEVGVSVVAVDIKEEWDPGNPDIQTITADLGEPSNIYQLIGAVMDLETRLDIVVHCVGLSLPDIWEDMRGDQIRQQFWVNTLSSIFLTNLSANVMRENGGHIVLFGSGAEQDLPLGYSVYAACKAGVRAFGETIAEELKEHNIYVNVIWPGAKSEMNPNSSHDPKDVAKFVCGLLMTQKCGHVFSVAGERLTKVLPRKLVPIDDIML